MSAKSLAEYFGCTYVINLPERKDRRKAITSELATAGMSLSPGKVEIFPAVKPSERLGFPKHRRTRLLPEPLPDTHRSSRAAAKQRPHHRRRPASLLPAAARPRQHPRRTRRTGVGHSSTWAISKTSKPPGGSPFFPSTTPSSPRTSTPSTDLSFLGSSITSPPYNNARKATLSAARCTSTGL